MDNAALCTWPNGSNDDWYWLYAAVKLRCLLVTNDEMRDHIFELIGSSFSNKWKERHQVHYTFVKGNLKLQMPYSYSLVIQVIFIIYHDICLELPFYFVCWQIVNVLSVRQPRIFFNLWCLMVVCAPIKLLRGDLYCYSIM